MDNLIEFDRSNLTASAASAALRRTISPRPDNANITIRDHHSPRERPTQIGLYTQSGQSKDGLDEPKRFISDKEPFR
jgi:hypothetical protein